MSLGEKEHVELDGDLLRTTIHVKADDQSADLHTNALTGPTVDTSGAESRRSKKTVYGSVDLRCLE